MLKKLFKQEFKSFSLAPTIAMILLAVFTIIIMTTFMTSFWDQSYNIFVELFSGLIILAYIFTLAAVSICITICTAVRFYRNFFTDEGYLMFTLPVKPSELLLSKILVAACWRLISTICICLSIFGIAFIAVAYIADTGIVQFFQEFFDLFTELISMEWMQEYFIIPLPLILIWLLLMGICGLLFDILFIHTCICVGQLFHKHKIGGAIISYFVLRFVVRIFRQLITLPISDVYLYYDTKSISSGTWILFMSVSLLATAGMCFAMYFICHYIITRKLNLD
ncbi:MAG: hypothetical protein HFI10_07060 [Lachnospiraceae bacterium]|jgi:hypothetical protein|nr:hypothetical protein [Lachnospiraceae bacterium]